MQLIHTIYCQDGPKTLLIKSFDHKQNGYKPKEHEMNFGDNTQQNIGEANIENIPNLIIQQPELKHKTVILNQYTGYNEKKN